MAVLGLMNTLVLEGAKNNIRVNALAPTAGTRMTENLIPDEAYQLMTPESVTAGALVLCHSDAPNRTILCAGAGGYASTRLFETDGIFLPPEQQTPDAVVEQMDGICNTDDQAALQSAGMQTDKFVGKAIAYLQSQQ